MLGACPRGRGLYSSTCQLLAAGIKILERRQQTQSNSQATGRLWPIFETNSYMTRSRSQCSRPARRPGAIWSDAASQESLPARPQPPNGEGPTQSLTPSTPQMGHRAHATPQGWGAARTQLKKKAQVRGRFSFHSGAVGGTERVISVVAKGFRSVSTKRILRVLARREQCARSKSSALQQSRTGRCGRLPSLCRLCPCARRNTEISRSQRGEGRQGEGPAQPSPPAPRTWGAGPTPHPGQWGAARTQKIGEGPAQPSPPAPCKWDAGPTPHTRTVHGALAKGLTRNVRNPCPRGTGGPYEKRVMICRFPLSSPDAFLYSWVFTMPAIMSMFIDPTDFLDARRFSISTFAPVTSLEDPTPLHTHHDIPLHTHSHPRIPVPVGPRGARGSGTKGSRTSKPKSAWGQGGKGNSRPTRPSTDPRPAHPLCDRAPTTTLTQPPLGLRT